MVKIGTRAGRKTSALITNMDIPLGYAIGNTLELIEAINTLRGNGPSDLTKLCVSLAAEMASLSLGIDFDEAKCRAENALFSGVAFKKFKEWVALQGADVTYADNTDKFEKASYAYEIKARSSGFIEKMDAEKIGIAAMELGAGRKTKDDVIDFSAGIILSKKTGDEISSGDTLATLYTNNEPSLSISERLFLEAVTVSDAPKKSDTLIYKTIKE